MSHAANTYSMVACSRPPRKLPYRLGENSPPLAVSEGDRTQLQRVANSTTMPHVLVPRARMPFRQRGGPHQLAAMHRVGASPPAVGKWRQRYLDTGAAASVTNSDPAPPLRRRTGRPSDRRCLARKARGRHPLVPSLRPQAAPSQDLQAVRGSRLHRESPRYRGALRRSAGSCHGALGGRASADPRLGPDPAATAL